MTLVVYFDETDLHIFVKFAI